MNDQMPSSWNCKVCNISYNEMFYLPCRHLFCETCFYNWIGIYIDMYRSNGGRFPCQACWGLYEVPFNGLRAFRQDITVLQLESQLDKIAMGTESNAMATDESDSDKSVPQQQEQKPVNDKPWFDPGYCYRSHQLYQHMI